MESSSAGAAQEAILPENTVAPNQYHLTGDGITVSYYPNGFGPLADEGAVVLTYHDATRGATFRKSQVEITPVPQLGEFVTAELFAVPDLGLTSISVLVPEVRLPEQGVPASVSTYLLKTLFKSGLFLPPTGQQQVYSLVALTGEARDTPLPL
jgi:hypothetical protein